MDTKVKARGKVYSLYQRRVLNQGELVDQPEGFDFPVADVVNQLPMPDSHDAVCRERMSVSVIDRHFCRAWNDYMGYQVSKPNKLAYRGAVRP